MENPRPQSGGSAQVTDLGLAAALICVGCVMLGTERNEANRVYFVFKDGEGLQAATRAYWDNELELMSARAYFEAIKSLKNLIYNGRF